MFCAKIRLLFTRSKSQWSFKTLLNLHVSYKLYILFTIDLLATKLGVLISSTPSSIPKQRRSLGHHRWFHIQFPPFFCILHCPLGLCQLKTCPFPDVIFPPLPLTALSSFPFYYVCLARWFWRDLMNGRHVHTTAVCVSLLWSGGLHVVQLPTGSWHGLPHW